MTSPDWPPLPYAEWESTLDTLHMWTQIVGKTRRELTPLVNHWWNVTLYVTPRGLTTSTIPFGHEAFEVDFDFIGHRLLIETSKGDERSIELRPRSVADFYKEYMSTLRSLGIEAKIHTMPDEFDDKIPFEQDTKHASYDRKYVESFRRILLSADRVFKEFRCAFSGQMQPGAVFLGFDGPGGDAFFRAAGFAAKRRRCNDARGVFARSQQLRILARRPALQATRLLFLYDAGAGGIREGEGSSERRILGYAIRGIPP